MKKKQNLFVTTLLVFGVSYFFFSALIPVVEELAGVDNIARIKIHEVISIEPSLFGGSGSESILLSLKQAQSDPSIKAILLDIDSPGGGPVASFEVYKKIKELDKPVVVVIREVGASGAYWISSGANHIIANELSLVGSVGVTASFLSFEDLMKEFGVSYNRLVSGEQKDLFSQYRNRTVEEEKVLQDTVQKIFEVFLNSVENDRNLTIENKAIVSNGGVFLGEEALSLGLIDEVGGFNEAEKWLVKELGSKKINYVDFSSSSFSVLDLVKSSLRFDSFKISLI